MEIVNKLLSSHTVTNKLAQKVQNVLITVMRLSSEDFLGFGFLRRKKCKTKFRYGVTKKIVATNSRMQCEVITQQRKVMRVVTFEI